MESEKKQNEPQGDKRRSADEIFNEIDKSVMRLLWTTNIAIFYLKYLQKAIRVAGSLLVASWLGLILIGIWSDKAIYYKIAFTILVSGGILVYLGKAIADLFEKPKPRKEESAPISKEVQDMFLTGILMDKFRNDENYRKQVSRKYFDEMVNKKKEQEQAHGDGNGGDNQGSGGSLAK